MRAKGAHNAGDGRKGTPEGRKLRKEGWLVSAMAMAVGVGIMMVVAVELVVWSGDGDGSV